MTMVDQSLRRVSVCWDSVSTGRESRCVVDKVKTFMSGNQKVDFLLCVMGIFAFFVQGVRRKKIVI